MSKSFKLHLFIHMIFAALFVIVVNRQISQNFVYQQTENRMRQEMAHDLSACQQEQMGSAAFIRCAQVKHAGEIYNAVKDNYLWCPATEPSLQSKPCDQIKQLDMVWQPSNEKNLPHQATSEFMMNGEVWLGHKDLQSNHVLIINKKWVDDFVAQLWQIRDQNISKSIPPVLLSMLLLAIYMAYIALRPLKLIENKMAQLNLQSLFADETIASPYKEFDQLIKVYHDLRKRLADSFSKARRFSSDVSHELRTPLSILRGNAERMITDLPVGSPTQIQARLMSDEIERLILITEKLLLLSRADANSLQLEKSQMPLSQKLRALMRDAKSFHPHLSIQHNIQEGVQWMCDPQLVHQLLQNLYTNAVKYNRPNGWISVTLTSDATQLTLTLENASEQVSPDLAERAFDRFFRGDASRTRHVDGFGLGLSICQEIVRAHQGTLTLEVLPEQTVRLTLTAPLH